MTEVTAALFLALWVIAMALLAAWGITTILSAWNR